MGSRSRVSYSYKLPAPIGGWNTRDPIDALPETDAIVLDNVLPEATDVRLRNGFRQHTPNTGIGSNTIYTLHTHVGVTGTQSMLAAANGDIWDVTTYDTAPTNKTGAIGAFSVNKWNVVNYKSTSSSTTRSIWVNGTDNPQIYDGSAFDTGARPFYTGVADETKLINVTSFKTQLVFLEYDGSAGKTNMWYLAVNSFKGALTALDNSALLKKGGKFLCIGNYGQNSGSGMEDILVVMSDQGEILLFSGTSASSLSLIGRYFAPRPLDSRSFVHVDRDLWIITIAGIFSLSDIIQGNGSDNIQPLTDKIRDTFNQAAKNYGTNYGWNAAVYNRGHYLVVNIPIQDNLESHQYAMNLQTGAWCRLTGQNAVCWCILNDKLYFSGAADGKVYESDYGMSDNSSYIVAKVKQAFSYFNDASSTKRVTLVKPTFVSSPNISFTLDLDADFSHKTISGTVATNTGTSTPWGSPWGSAWGEDDNQLTNNWYGVSGLGRNFALRMEGNFKDKSWLHTSTNFIYESGGLL